jgi:hypothetical protein
MILALVLAALAGGPAGAAPGAPTAPTSDAVEAEVQVLQLADAAWPPGVPAWASATVLVRLDATGGVEAARLVRSDDPWLGRAAVRAARQARGAPGEGARTVRWVWVHPDAEEASVVEVVARAPWRARTEGPLGSVGQTPGAWRLSGADLEQTAGSGGDAVRALQALPGVQAPRLSSTALSIRAGAPDETLWAVEGVPLPAPRSAGTVLSRLPSLWIDGLTLHGGLPPAALPAVAGGVVDVALVGPSEEELDGAVELGPGVVQGRVSGPLGRPGAGQALQLGIRRTALEPALALLERRGLAEGVALTVEDALARMRLRPHPDHDVDALVLLGRTRVRPGGLAPGLDLPREDRTATGLGLLRHRWTPAAGLAAHHQLALTREVQDVVQAADDDRRDVRDRLEWRGQLTLAEGSHRVGVGGGVAGFRLRGAGVLRDPRVAPPFERLPWRRMDPPAVSLEPQASWSEAFAWASWGLEGAGAELTATLRMDRWRGRWRPSPRLSAGVRIPGPETRVALSAALVHPLPRDPLELDPLLGRQPLVPTRAFIVAGEIVQPLSEDAIVRIAPWLRRQDGLTVWEGAGGPSRPDGVGSAQGVDAWLAVRASRAAGGALGGSLVDARRGFGEATTRVPWAAPWTVHAQAHGSLGPGRAWRLGGRVQVRAGVEQVALRAEARDGQVVVVPDLSERRRLPPVARLALRAAWEGVLVGSIDTTLFLDLVGTAGPLGEALVGGEAVGDDLVVPPRQTRTRDLPLLPWLGARMWF